MLTVGSLFSGIGGLELGLERAGMRTVWQVERDEYCRRVLAKHWPDVERFEDVKDVGAHNLKPVDLICGGFPCQDISYAGKGGGLEGERSGLFYELLRVVREKRPRYVLLENVAALLGRGIDAVLWELAAIGYDAEWECVSAASVGAPHLRVRIFLVAYPQGDGWAGGRSEHEGRDPDSSIGDRLRIEPAGVCPSDDSEVAPDPNGIPRGLQPLSGPQRCGAPVSGHDGPTQSVADADALDAQGIIRRRHDTENGQVTGERPLGLRSGTWRDSQWETEPDVGRVAHGVPSRIHRLKALGNAVVPQVAEYIGRLIVEADKEMRGAA